MAPKTRVVQRIETLLAIAVAALTITTAAMAGTAYVVRLDENVRTLTNTMQTLNATLEKGVDRIGALEQSVAALNARVVILETK